jgi:hypothetical protein
MCAADQPWIAVQEEDRQNRQLLCLFNQILELTEAVLAYAASAANRVWGRRRRRHPPGRGRER